MNACDGVGWVDWNEVAGSVTKSLPHENYHNSSPLTQSSGKTTLAVHAIAEVHA